MGDDPRVEAIDDALVDVEATVAAYEDAPAHYVEKFRRRATADRFGEEFLARLPDPPARPRVLDVGCGPGPDAAVFVDRGVDVVGLDRSEGLLRAAAADVPDAGYARGDMRRLPVADGAVDGVWSSASLLHLARSDVPRTLEEFARVLGDGGVLFVSVMAREANQVDAVESADGRQFTFWRKSELIAALDAAGFGVRWDSDQSDWHALVAVRE